MFPFLAAAFVLALAPAPPSTEVGPFRFTRERRLTWPGIHAPDFRLILERRWVHRFSFGFAHRTLRPFSIDVVGVEASRDPTLRQRTMAVPSLEGAHAAWLGARWTPPRSNLSLTFGRPLAVLPGLVPALRQMPRSATKFSVHGRF